MQIRLFLALAGALLLLRLPAVVQPMGADQGLYAYVGQRILAGDLPYRDAWDQKPPAIHYTYAAVRAIWPGETAVGAADFLAAAAVAWLLFRLGTVIAPGATGGLSALLFLLLSNPSFTRLGGIRLRSQCETFIAVAVTGAFLLLCRRPVPWPNPDRTSSPNQSGSPDEARQDAGPLTGRARLPWPAIWAGVLFGVAFLFKYNAGIYAAAGLTSLWLWRRLTLRDAAAVALGFAVPVLLTIAIFAVGGALADLYHATITYNVQYSGQTYAGPGAVIAYLATFPIDRARVDALWTLGGAGCLLLVALGVSSRERLIAPLWVAAACLSIAVNGSRGLPQYFEQANPALALAAGWAAVEGWQALRRRPARIGPLLQSLAIVLIGVAVWRVNQFPKLVEQTLFDARYALGAIPRTDYLARYADDRKYSSLASAQLADVIRNGTTPDERVFVFGFTCAAYVDAGRASASRFFWSRPVIVGFEAGMPGYGVDGLLAELVRQPPRIVALQRKDWAPDVSDSAAFFLGTPALAGWLKSNYVRRDGPDAFELWTRKAGPS